MTLVHEGRSGSAPVPDPLRGFYGPASAMWRINREAVLLGAGPTALLLQIAHPLVAEGVAQHSDFEADPFGRLRRTLDTTLAMVFGDGPTAERAIRRLNGVHASVRGPVLDPAAVRATDATAYRALDPELLLWVQATLVVTSIRAYRAWVGHVSDAEADELWQEARRVGIRLGIPLRVSPVDWSTLERWFEATVAHLEVTDTARRLAPGIIRPPLPAVPGWAVDLLALPGLALLPPSIRDGFAIPWDDRRALTAGFIGRCARAWATVVPVGLRSMPQARAADRRTRTR